MKAKSDNTSQSGFTLVELLVAVAILAVFYGLVATNFNIWRGPQFVKFSANEMATNINKVRSYSLSARSMDGSPVRYYLLRLERGSQTNEYRVQAIIAGTPNDTFMDRAELAKLSGNTYISQLSLRDRTGVTTQPSCVQVAFSLPYGRTLMDGACSFTASNFSRTLQQLDFLANGYLEITIARQGAADTKKVIVDGLSGQVRTE